MRYGLGGLERLWSRFKLNGDSLAGSYELQAFAIDAADPDNPFQTSQPFILDYWKAVLGEYNPANEAWETDISGGGLLFTEPVIAGNGQKTFPD